MALLRAWRSAGLALLSGLWLATGLTASAAAAPAVTEMDIGPYHIVVPTHFVYLVDRESNSERSTLLVHLTAAQAGLPTPAHLKTFPIKDVYIRFRLADSDEDRLSRTLKMFRKGLPRIEDGFRVYEASGGYSMFLPIKGGVPPFMMCQDRTTFAPDFPLLCDLEATIASRPTSRSLLIQFGTRGEYFGELPDFYRTVVNFSKAAVSR